MLDELTQRTVLIGFERDWREKADQWFCKPEVLVRTAAGGDELAVGDQLHAGACPAHGGDREGLRVARGARA